MFARVENLGEEETFEDIFKKNLVKAMGMIGRCKLNRLHVEPYLRAVLKRGMKRREGWETADPILKEVIMYSTAVDMDVELLEGMVSIIDTMEMVEVKVIKQKEKVGANFQKLDNSVGVIDMRVEIIKEWKRDVTDHIHDTGEAQGEVHHQLQAVLVGMSWEMGEMGDVIQAQNDAFQVQ